MSTEVTFDVLFRDLFNAHSRFGSISEIKIPHPVDIYEDAEGLVFEIACTGLSKKDVEIDIEHDVLKVTHTKENNEEAQGRVYQARGIARRSFSLAYKISSIAYRKVPLTWRMDYWFLSVMALSLLVILLLVFLALPLERKKKV